MSLALVAPPPLVGYEPKLLGARCDKCPLGGPKRRPVPPQTSRGATKLIVVGEAPGRYEVLRGIPFIGPSGKVLDDMLREKGFDRRDAHITNASICRGESDDEIKAATACCAIRLGNELKVLPEAAPILALGASCVKPILGRGAILKVRGFVWKIPEVTDQQLRNAKKVLDRRAHPLHGKRPNRDQIQKARASLLLLQGRRLIQGRVVIPSLHPAFLLRGADAWRPVFAVDVEKAVKWSRAPFPLEDEGPYVESCDPKVVRQTLNKMRSHIAVDIETDGVDPLQATITCIGVSDDHDGQGTTLVISPWKAALGPTLNAALRKRTSVTHNGPAFDEIALRRRKILMPQHEDTLIAHHAFASHLRQGLDHVASVYCLYGNTPVVLANGRREKIAKIVANRMPVEIMTLGPDGMEPKRVVNWHMNTKPDQKWIQIRTEDQQNRNEYRGYGRGLVVTPDHKVYTQRGWIRADKITTFDYVAVPERRLNDLEVGAFIGTLLGDSSMSLTKRKHRRYAVPTAAVVGVHKKSVGLAQAKAKAMRGFLYTVGEVTPRHFSSDRPGNVQLRYATLASRQIKSLQPLLYDARGRKRITVEALDALGPVGLAWWIADDGCVAKRGLRLATDGFEPGDVETARDWFVRKFGPVSLYKTTSSLYGTRPQSRLLGIRYEAAEAICEFIAPYMFPCVRYKLPNFRKWPKYINEPLSHGNQPLFVKVISAGPYEPIANYDQTMPWRSYCLTVEDNRNFFTPVALVANCDAGPWKAIFKAKGAEEKGGLAKYGVASEDLARYNAADVRLDIRCWDRMKPDLDTERRVYDFDMRIAKEICQEMQRNGLLVDQTRRWDLAKKLKFRSAALLGEMRSLLRRPNFNPGSLVDLRRALFVQCRAPKWLAPPTKTGLLSTGKLVLEALRGSETRGGKLADLIMRRRSANDIRSEYLVNLPIGKDNRVHATWKSFGAVSGRPSTARPNVLNMPRMSKDPNAHEEHVRDIYVAPRGYKFVYFDLAQAEPKFAAWISGDENFIETCKGDVHTNNACILFPKFAELIRSDPKGKGKIMRQISKTCGLAVTYYAVATTVYGTLHAEGFDVSLPEVEALIRVLSNKYRGWFKYTERNVEFAKKHGFIRSPFLGRIQWTGFYPSPSLIANWPCQSGVADVMGERLLEMQSRRPKKARLVMYAYDSATWEVPDAEVGLMQKLLVEQWAIPIAIPGTERTFVQDIELKVGERLSEL